MKVSLSVSWLKKLTVIVLITLICVAPVVAMGITNVAQVSATIVLSPESGYGHTIVRVSGSGFTKSKSVVVDFAGMPVLSTRTRSDGSFEGQFVVPTDQDGTYTVRAVDKKGIQASKSFTVTIDPKLVDIENKLDQLIEKLSDIENKLDQLVVKLAIVYDIDMGRGDMSFGTMAAMGADRAAKELGVELIELHCRTEEDYVPNLITAAEDPHVQLIVGVGFLFSDALVEVARMFPDKNFAGLDTYSQLIVQSTYPAEYPLPNLMDIVYEEHKGSALVGALGALLAAYYGKPYIGAVLGKDIPVLWEFEIGYKWGCDWAINWTMENHPELTAGIVTTPRNERVLWTYTGTFSDITKGYEAAKPMYEQDAVAVYNIAGPLGLGINQAVAEITVGLEMGPPFWIGVDVDQDWINPGFVIASMMKRVDKSVYYATKLVRGGLFRDIVKATEGTVKLGIGTIVAGVLMEGISVSTLEDLEVFIEMGIKAGTIKPEDGDIIYNKVKAMREAQPAWIWDAVAELEEKIREGEVEVPLVTTEEARDYWRGIFG